MALISCPECGKEVSSKALFCPKCGYPIKETLEITDHRKEEIDFLQRESLNTDKTHKHAYKPTQKEATKQKKKSGGCLIPIIAFLLLFSAIGSCEDGNSVETTQEEETQNTEDKKNETETEVFLSEEEYKFLCKELYYEDVLFGDVDLQGEKIKLNVLFSEKKFFTVDDMYSSTFQKYHSKYSLRRDFFAFCVLRKDSESYVGRSINSWFSNHYDVNPGDYEVGQKAIVYADVVSWSNNTWDGYNSVVIIPRYIDIIK